VEEVFTPDGLAKVLSRADYVVLCVPLTAETRGMFGVDEFRLMKDTAYLVNVGRGPLVREDTLLEALRRRWIAGAGLDVFETEPLPPDHPLYNLDNVIISPHVAGVTPYYWERMAKLFVENLKRFLAGEELEKKVDKARGY
jgi:phosphoglycerate dehydrogenase-like enzyme